MTVQEFIEYIERIPKEYRDLPLTMTGGDRIEREPQIVFQYGKGLGEEDNPCLGITLRNDLFLEGNESKEEEEE